MCQCRLIDCNTGTPLVKNVGSGGGYVLGGQGGI